MTKNGEENKRVLIVEDDALQSLLLDKFISKLGYNVIGKTAKGEEAVDLALELEPDIITMDIYLEHDMDGITAVEEIHKSKIIPIIYITGNSDEYNLKRVQNTQFVDYLLKPITIESLRQPLIKASKICEQA